MGGLDLFSASEGLFHFVFADQQGEFITPSLLKLKFIPYLQQQLIASNFQYIYIIRHGQDLDESYIMQSLGYKSISFDVKKEKNFFCNFFNRNKLFSKKDVNSDSQSFGVIKDEITANEMKNRLFQILEFMQNQREVSLAIPFYLINKLRDDEKLHLLLKKLVKNNHGNVIVLFGSLYKDENDDFFRRKSLENRDLYDMSIFFDMEIFPEIESAFSVNKQINRVPYYRLLSETLGKRIQVWNSFSYEEISAAIRYKFIHSNDIPFEKALLIDKYSEFLCMWYNDSSFNDIYYNLTINDNPKRSVIDLVNNLDSPEFRERIEEIISDNFIYNESDFSEKCIIADNSEDKSFVNFLMEYRNILRSSENLLEDLDIKKLLEITEFFREPALIYYKNLCPPTYKKFIENENKKFFKDLFKFLKNEQRCEGGWNSWDKSAAYIIYVLICYCYDDALKDYDEDMYHINVSEAFNKSISVLKYIKLQSKKSPFADELALKYTKSFIKCLDSKDYSKIRMFKEEGSTLKYDKYRN